MRKLLIVPVCCVLCLYCSGQSQKRLSGYLMAQYNNTLYDYTLGNNPWGFGLGFRGFYNNKTKFKPTLDFTSDIYMEDDKVFRSAPNGIFPETDNTVRSMTNLFIGASYQPIPDIYLSVVAGPSFIKKERLFGIKPTVGFYFSKSKQLTARISYVNIFNRTKIVDEDFGSLSVGVGIKLF